jgi:hypothetical protein
MTSEGPRHWFPNFYENPAIRAIASASRWTISGRLGDETDPESKESTRKAPIDVRHLLDGCNISCRHTGPLRGAWSIDSTCLVTLDELTDAIPQAANTAFYLQAQTDGLMVLDIEPDCPPGTAAELLRLPGTLYKELSMSRRGFHLVAPLPKNFHDFPIAAGKRVLREKNGHYELLLDHWATFTRDPVPQRIIDHVAARPAPVQFTSYEDLYASLAEHARASASGSALDIDTSDEMPEIPYAREIVGETLDQARDQLRSIDDFDNDHSRWEFSVLASLYSWMRTQLRSYSAVGIEYASSDIAWLLYAAAIEVIPTRPKHSQRRNGRPFLLDRAAALVADRESNTAGT